MRPTGVLFLIALAACQPAPHRSQSGEYHASNKMLTLANGDTFTVYRVKYWVFSDGEPPALQLEYAPHGPVSDTAALRKSARAIWPAFEPYLRAARVTGAILTATELSRVAVGAAFVSRNKSFGILAHQSADGSWKFDGETAALPAGETTGTPRIRAANGAPLAPEALVPASLATPPAGEPAAAPDAPRR
jgi:hypothetical protein